MTSDDAPTRITVSLIRKTEDALTALADSTGMSKTDLVNRAVQLYAFVQNVEDANGQVLIRREDGEVERVQFL